MIRQFISIPLIFILIGYSCTHENSPKLNIPSIQTSDCVGAERLSDVFSITGYTRLETNENCLLKSPAKIIFYENKLYLMDDPSGEKEAIYCFDKAGKFLYPIGRAGENLGEYAGLRDFDIDKENQEIVTLVAGKMAFMRYSLDGKFSGQIPTPFFGDQLVILNKNHYLVYNEGNAVSDEECFYLYHTNSKGKINKKEIPYNPAMDNASYAFTGFLVPGVEGSLFAPPFSDTIYAIDMQGNSRPILQVNTGPTKITPDIYNDITKIVSVGLNTSYLNSITAATNKAHIFSYFFDRRVREALYFWEEGRCVDLSTAGKKDALFQLFGEHGLLQCHTEDTFMVLIDPPKLLELAAKDPETWAAAEQEYPILFQIRKEVTSTDNPVILFVKVK